MENSADAGEVVGRALEQIPVLNAELARLDDARKLHQQDLAHLENEWSAAWQHLGRVLLPECSQPVCDRAAKLLALPDVAWSAVSHWCRLDTGVWQHELGSVEQHPSFQARDAIRNECNIRMADLADAMAPLRASLNRFEAQPRWRHLMEIAYGTDSYQGNWWTLSYYQDWKYADKAVESMAPFIRAKTFPELRAVYESERSAFDELQRAKSEFLAQIGEVNALIERHIHAHERLASVSTRALTRAQGHSVDHLQPLNAEDVASLLGAHEPASVAHKRILGIGAKITYLKSVHQEWVEKPRAQILRALQKNRKDVEKLLRPKHASRHFDRRLINDRFADRSQSWNKRWHHYNESRNALIMFEDYHLYNMQKDIIWWSLMTHDQIKPRFIPEVRDFYDHHHDPHQSAVAAIAYSGGMHSSELSGDVS